MATAAPAVQPGTLIAAYEVRALAGQGTSSEVFLAIDQRSRQPVALKLLRTDAAAEAGGPQRFADEAAAMQRLRHPDIAAVLDAGHWQGRDWMAIEWLPGHDLSRYTVARRLLPPALALGIAERVALALGHAHRAGFVHRDIKPANVRVHLPAARVKLCDFGLARTADSQRTRTGVILGTPAYMAPEQLAGEVAGPAADLYALGVLAFELLTGTRPHDDSGSLGELLRQVAQLPAPDLRQRWPQAPPALAGEMARLLAKAPALRHADADAVAAMFARARAHVSADSAG